MKIPESPPKLQEIFQTLSKDPAKLLDILGNISATDEKKRYQHWHKMQFQPDKDGFTAAEQWAGAKIARHHIRKELPFVDVNNQPFYFCIPEVALEKLHYIDQNSCGNTGSTEPIINSSMRDSYLINSLMEEAIYSSQLEGAATTRKVAKEMLRQNRAPRNKSEQMIFNNYDAMRFIHEHQEEALTPALIYELHRIVTHKTLENEADSGRIRMSDDIHIIDNQQNVLFVPPSAETLPERIARLCTFANRIEHDYFIHPVIKGILLHFILAYDHPFVDGNGRTARALFYWFLTKNHYWLLEYISISQILKEAPGQYTRSFLYTESDENDTTYFIMHQLEAIEKAITRLHDYLAQKTDDLQSVAALLENSRLADTLNHRQLAVIDHALKNPDAIFRIKVHQTTHGIAYQTARTDLLALADTYKLLHKVKDGNTILLLAPADLKERLQKLSE